MVSPCKVQRDAVRAVTGVYREHLHLRELVDPAVPPSVVSSPGWSMTQYLPPAAVLEVPSPLSRSEAGGRIDRGAQPALLVCPGLCRSRDSRSLARQ